MGGLPAYDFDRLGYEKGFHASTGVHGLWELSGPAKGAIASNNGPDEFIFRPGDHIPEVFLPDGCFWVGIGVGGREG